MAYDSGETGRKGRQAAERSLLFQRGIPYSTGEPFIPKGSRAATDRGAGGDGEAEGEEGRHDLGESAAG